MVRGKPCPIINGQICQEDNCRDCMANLRKNKLIGWFNGGKKAVNKPFGNCNTVITVIDEEEEDKIES